MGKYIVVTSQPGGEQGVADKRDVCRDHSFCWGKRGRWEVAGARQCPPQGFIGRLV